ncbi:MAG: hypothetical protein Q8876_06515, partial [Bacillota bacterium]|nr:hypothetical protein [Bacillota bacterium]
DKLEKVWEQTLGSNLQAINLTRDYIVNNLLGITTECCIKLTNVKSTNGSSPLEIHLGGGNYYTGNFVSDSDAATFVIDGVYNGGAWNVSYTYLCENSGFCSCDTTFDVLGNDSIINNIVINIPQSTDNSGNAFLAGTKIEVWKR